MELEVAETLARHLMSQHGLSDWGIRLDHARQRCGSCHYTKREITLSKHFVRLNDDVEVRDTILHEIAHALVGPRTAHGPRWQQTAARIGAPVRATNTSAAMPEPAWHLQCESCLRIVAKRHRKKIRLQHARCSYCGLDRGVLRWLASDSDHSLSPST